MLRKFLCVAALAMIAVPAQAGVFGSALITTSNMRVQRLDGGAWRFANSTDVKVLTTSHTASNLAMLQGLTPDGHSAASMVAGVTVDAAQAFVTSGAESKPAENLFARTVPLPASSAFARSDAFTKGALLVSGGLSTSSIAEIEASDTSLGASQSSSGGQANFELDFLQAGTYRFIFDATVDAIVDSDGPPADRIAFASTSLSIQVNGSNVTLDDEDLLGVTLSGTDSFSDTYTQITSGSITLGAGIGTLQIVQRANVGLSAVPEPGTMLAFVGILAAGGVSVSRRRRRQVS